MTNLSALSELIDKYDVPGPRYTSYPTVPAWKGLPNGVESWKDALQTAFKKSSDGVSIYLHIPFCRSLCAFCGCTKVITRDRSKAALLIRAIHRELELYAPLLPKKIPLKEVHLGGGTPTWLSPCELEELLHPFLAGPSFTSDSSTALSIEVDPRTATSAHVDTLAQLGFSRVSIGVQDFNPEVMKIIRREQPPQLVENLVNQLRSKGIQGINFDLVYGLPKQTVDSVSESLQRVLTLKPNRVAFYSYAHVPWIRPAQKLLEPHGLPLGAGKRALYEAGREVLAAHGYQEIGMDHFTLPSDELFAASTDSRLHRNFMGYTVRRSELLLGLGPSSLSDCGDAFAQNEKDVNAYFAKVDQGTLPIVHGHILSPLEHRRRNLILDVSCRLKANFEPEEISDKERAQLASLEEDELLNLEKRSLTVTSLGRMFLRNICMALDPTIQDRPNEPASPLFSRAI